MSKALALRESQVRALIRAARRENARLEVRIGEAVITVFPEERQADNQNSVDAPAKGYL